MALYIEQHFGQQEGETQEKCLTFQDYVAHDVGQAFFNTKEHASIHQIDGKDMPVILDEDRLREHSSNWEAGAKQNFDTGLYRAVCTIYVRKEDYGPKPQIGKLLIFDGKRTYKILNCQEEDGIYRMSLERTRQG